jgi:hypothetical protein
LNTRDGTPSPAGLAASSRPAVVEVQPHGARPERRRSPEDIEDWEARLAADDELIQQLAWESYSGPESEKLYKALAEYGTQIIGAWVFTGAIFPKCIEKGLRPKEFIDPIPIRLEHEREYVVVDTVSRAVVGFRDTVLRRGKWSAANGASLKTFFIGQALIRFVTVYRGWLSDRVPTTPLLDTMPATDPDLGDPEARLMHREALREGLATIDDVVVRHILALEGLGYDQAQIAEILGLPSPKSVEMRKYHYRRDHKGAADVA